VGSSAGNATTSYGFTREQQDSSSGLVYFRARFYSSRVGRFVSKDAWGGDDKISMSYNDWLYAYSNPLRYIDPTGEIMQTAALDSLRWNLYNLLNHAVRSRQPGMLIEKERPGWKPPQPPTAEVARLPC
jgi:RHS repeat-associated protein